MPNAIRRSNNDAQILQPQMRAIRNLRASLWPPEWRSSRPQTGTTKTGSVVLSRHDTKFSAGPFGSVETVTDSLAVGFQLTDFNKFTPTQQPTFTTIGGLSLPGLPPAPPLVLDPETVTVDNGAGSGCPRVGSDNHYSRSSLHVDQSGCESGKLIAQSASTSPGSAVIRTQR
jgi:hypothetical protein